MYDSVVRQLLAALAQSTTTPRPPCAAVQTVDPSASPAEPDGEAGAARGQAAARR